ncbi:RICIN domain-containing protein [Streptomyces sp. NPDC002537]
MNALCKKLLLAGSACAAALMTAAAPASAETTAFPSFTVKNLATKGVLDLPGGNDENGAQLWTYRQFVPQGKFMNESQMWVFNRYDDGTFSLSRGAGKSVSVLDVDVNTHKVQLWSAFGGHDSIDSGNLPSNQKFRPYHTAKFQGDSGNWKVWQNVGTGLCVTAPSGAQQEYLVAVDCDKDDSRQYFDSDF